MKNLRSSTVNTYGFSFIFAVNAMCLLRFVGKGEMEKKN